MRWDKLENMLLSYHINHIYLKMSQMQKLRDIELSLKLVVRRISDSSYIGNYFAYIVDTATWYEQNYP